MNIVPYCISIFGGLLKIKIVNYTGLMVVKIIFIYWWIIHPRIAIADFVKDLKVSTSLWMKEKPEFKNFKGWAEGYASFTLSHNSKNDILEYIKSQKEHHKLISFNDEYKAILKENGLEFDLQESE